MNFFCQSRKETDNFPMLPNEGREVGVHKGIRFDEVAHAVGHRLDGAGEFILEILRDELADGI